jgi:hypothetical protein
VSSNDLRIGVNNLHFINQGKKTHLLSANIRSGRDKLFRSHFVHELKGRKIAFIGISSGKILFDIAEKNVFKIRLQAFEESLRESIKEMESSGADRIILLSGLSTQHNISILKSFRKVDLIISGGDNPGDLYGMGATRIDMEDGRSIVLLPADRGYYILNLDIESAVTVTNNTRRDVTFVRTEDSRYKEFEKRLGIWKKKFREDEDRILLKDVGKGCSVDAGKISNLMRDRFNAEISIVDVNSVSPIKISRDTKYSDIRKITGDDFPIFSYRLTGEDLNNLSLGTDYHVSGLADNRIQNYPVEEGRLYRIASTQSVFEKIVEKKKQAQKDLAFANNWINITDMIRQDLSGPRALFRDDYGYLDRRFRLTADIYLSNFIDGLFMKRGANIETPAGQVENAHVQWGMEDKIDFTIYNSIHQFILTPYLNYLIMMEDKYENAADSAGNAYREKRTEKTLINNLFRATFQYNLNLDYIINPYHKSQYDTAISKVEGLRPAIIRETIGGRIKKDFIEGKIGIGFEKKIEDPGEKKVYGYEAILTVKYDFLKYFAYSFNLESFLASRKFIGLERGYFRSDMENKLTFKFNKTLGLAFKYKFFYYYYTDVKESYRYNQFVTSLDLVTDFKMY